MPWSLEQCNEAECCAQEGSRLQQRCAQRSMLSSKRQQAAPCASVGTWLCQRHVELRGQNALKFHS